MALRGVSTSDWHLDGGLTRMFPLNAVDKQLKEIEKVFQYCVENDIRHLFMPGDLSDKARICEATFIALVTLLLRYDKYLSFYYTLGNHDVAHVGKTSIDVLKIFADSGVFKNVHLFSKPEVLDIEGVQVGFVPFPFKAAPVTDCAKLIFAHIEEAGAMGDYGTPLKSASVVLEREPDDYVVSGHLHTYQVLKKQRVLYNGALYQKTFGENPAKGFVDFQAKYKGDELLVRHTFVPSKPAFLLETLKIEDSADWDKIEAGDHRFYRIYLGEGVVAPKDLIRNFPNVIQVNGTTYRGKGTVEDKADVGSIPKITPLTGLVEFLMRYDLTKSETKRAVAMVREAIQQLN